MRKDKNSKQERKKTYCFTAQMKLRVHFATPNVHVQLSKRELLDVNKHIHV